MAPPESDHPSLDLLLRSKDNALPEGEQKAVQAHLAACDRCRSEMNRIAYALTSPIGLPAPPVAELLASLNELQSSLAQAGASGDALKRKVEAELTPYFGAEAAGRILQPVAPSGENLLSTVESVLRLFLGKTATDRVVTRIVDRAIMRT